MKTLLLLCLLLPLLSTSAAYGAAVTSGVFDVPATGGIPTGFQVKAFSPLDGPPVPGDPRGELTLSWSAKTLDAHVQIHVADIHESASPDALWDGDSVELFFSPSRSSQDILQIVVGPGADGTHTSVRTQLLDHRRTADLLKVPFAATVSAAKTATGYEVTAHLPLAALGIAPRVGAQAAFQIVINHASADGSRRRFAWYPSGEAWHSSADMAALMLSDHASAPVTVTASVKVSRLRRLVVNVLASSELAGRAVSVELPNGLKGDGTLTKQDDIATADVRIAFSSQNIPAGDATVSIDGKTTTTAPIPDIADLRRRAAEQPDFLFKPTIFTPGPFPEGDFNEPELMENLLGPYTVRTTFYDAGYHVVTSAQNPGRYGAVVEVKPDNGTTLRFYITLFCASKLPGWQDAWWKGKTPTQFAVPPVSGIPEQVASEQSRFVGGTLRSLFMAGFNNSSAPAMLLAALSETKPGEPTISRLSPTERDARWWYPLKMKLGAIKFRYHVDVPSGYSDDPAKSWPLVLFLHGSGERGLDLEQVRANGLPKLIKQGKTFPFLVVSPQCDPNGWWSAVELNGLLDEVCAKYRVDAKRVYLTGLSMGGYGTWALAAAYPARFAAIAPVCGGGDTADALELKGIPTWIFHGGKDSTVPVENAYEMRDALNAVGAGAKLTIYPEAGHDSWTATYNEAELYTWMSAQHK